jgi:hypothetical protein
MWDTPSETTELLEMVISAPMTTAESEQTCANEKCFFTDMYQNLSRK